MNKNCAFESEDDSELKNDLYLTVQKIFLIKF